MSRISVSITVLFLALAAGTSRADATSVAIGPIAASPTLMDGGLLVDPSCLSACCDLPISGSAPDGANAPATTPAPPDSASLFLLGLGTLGAVQIGRSVRVAHWMHAPDWFHLDGPDQIGFAVSFDLDARDLPLCVLDTLVGVGSGAVVGFVRDDESSSLSEWTFAVDAPRGPPLSFHA